MTDNHNTRTLRISEHQTRSNIRLQLQDKYDCAKVIVELTKQAVKLANEYILKSRQRHSMVKTDCAQSRRAAYREDVLDFRDNFRRRMKIIIDGQPFSYFGRTFFYSDPANVTIDWLRRYLTLDIYGFYIRNEPDVSGKSVGLFVWRYRRLNRKLWRTAVDFIRRTDELLHIDEPKVRRHRRH